MGAARRDHREAVLGLVDRHVDDHALLDLDHLLDHGRFDIFCEIVDEAELEEILTDIESEEDEEELDEDYDIYFQIIDSFENKFNICFNCYFLVASINIMFSQFNI